MPVRVGGDLVHFGSPVGVVFAVKEDVGFSAPAVRFGVKTFLRMVFGR